MEGLTRKTGLKAGFFILRRQPTRNNPQLQIFVPRNKLVQYQERQKTILTEDSRVTATEAKNCEYYLILRKSCTITEWQKTERTIRVTITKAKNYYTQKTAHGCDMAKNYCWHTGFARDVRFSKTLT